MSTHMQASCCVTPSRICSVHPSFLAVIVMHRLFLQALSFIASSFALTPCRCPSSGPRPRLSSLSPPCQVQRQASATPSFTLQSIFFLNPSSSQAAFRRCLAYFLHRLRVCASESATCRDLCCMTSASSSKRAIFALRGYSSRLQPACHTRVCKCLEERKGNVVQEK